MTVSLNQTRYHLIGIGGCGMAGLAQMLKQQGFQVSGSDNADSPLLDHLKNLGISIFLGHNADQVLGANKIIISSAIKSNNPELIHAQKLNIPIIHRAQALADLIKIKNQKTILILGSHGKTTTTSLITSILISARLDPSYAIGATYYQTNLNAYLGSGEYFIIEGDESDQSFQYFHPDILVLTNIDEDHLEAYNHDIAELKKAYLSFIQKLPPSTLLIFNHQDFHTNSLIPEILKTHPRIKTYGPENKNNDLNISNIFISGMTSTFQTQGLIKNHFDLNLPGVHNIENAAAALLAVLDLNIPMSSMQAGLKNYQGASRRSEVHGEYGFSRDSRFLLIEDYGHHPVEIKVTMTALKLAYPQKRLVLVFQPHRYTRTQALFKDFVSILTQADVLVLLDIYSASEPAIPGVSSSILGAEIQKIKPHHFYLSSLENTLPTLQKIIQPNDLVLIQGAGDIHECIAKIKEITTCV